MAGIRNLKSKVKEAERRVLFWLGTFFLSSYLLVPYGTRYLEYGLHNLLLLAALPVAVLYGLRNRLLSSWEWLLLLGGSGTLLLSAAVHQASFAEFRPYLLAFVTYLVVRAALSGVPTGKLVNGLAGYAFLAGTLSLLQVYGGPAFYPASYLIDREPFYAAGFSHHPSFGAALLLWPLTLLAAEIVRGKSVKLFAWVGLFLGSYGLALTFSRGALLGFALVLGLLGVWVLVGARSALKHYAIVCLLAILAMAMAWSLPNRYSASASEKIVSKVEQPQDLGIEFAVERLALWKAISWMVVDHPLWGTGISGYQERLSGYLSQVPEMPESLFLRYRDLGPHNSYLTWSVYWGLASFAWVLGFLGLACWPLLRRSRRSGDAPFVLALIAVLANAVFHDLIGDRLFWIALATAIGVGYAQNSEAE